MKEETGRLRSQLVSLKEKVGQEEAKEQDLRRKYEELKKAYNGKNRDLEKANSEIKHIKESQPVNESEIKNKYEMLKSKYRVSIDF